MNKNYIYNCEQEIGHYILTTLAAHILDWNIWYAFFSRPYRKVRTLSSCDENGKEIWHFFNKLKLHIVVPNKKTQEWQEIGKQFFLTEQHCVLYRQIDQENQPFYVGENYVKLNDILLRPINAWLLLALPTLDLICPRELRARLNISSMLPFECVLAFE